ncbi:hypothetical protein J5A54_03215 [Prevotella melaninogenica]|uniref:hypothetical protein n=1 Tax=Prevotella melaninogenica TaxID=28132 RepID=UPI001BA4FDA9|nr:hypothetical protein [Prevotella melaninogenica]QUB63714.1 hypothetical protein J5A54_03215 [Prevotella melaninogenica]
MQARGQITIHNVYDGQSAEFYRLKAVREDAVVNAEGVLNATFRYEIEHVKGSTIITEKGKVGELYVSCTTNTNINVPISVGMKSEGTFRLENYIKAVNRPDYFTIELKSGNDVLETRTIQVMMEAASYTKIVNDMRESVSTNGKDITTIKQDAKSISLIVDGLRTGVRNLLTGGKLEKTYHSYGYGNGNTHIKLKPNTTYTMTISGHTSDESIANGQTLQAYIIADGWAWSAGGGNLEISSAKDTIKHYTFTTPNELPNDGVCVFDAYPTPNREPQGKNGEVTVNWAVVTEGTAPAAEWIPSVEESSEERVKKVEAKLENGEFRVKSDKTVFVDNNGKETVLIEDGKLSAALIDAVKIVAAGIQAQEIDAGKATISNLIVDGESEFRGKLKGTSGSFTSLDCLDTNKNKVGGIKFGTLGNKSYMAFTGDFGMWGETTGDIRKRFPNFYATNVYCNSQFGHKSRVCAVIRDEEMFVYNDGHIDSNGIRIMLTFGLKEINGRKTNYYKIPMYSPGFGGESGTVMDIDNPKAPKGTQTYYDELPVGVPIDVVIFNCTRDCVYDFIGMGYGKQWTVINGNDDTSVTICCHGGASDVLGGYILIAAMSILLGCRRHRLTQPVLVQVSWWAESWI